VPQIIIVGKGGRFRSSEPLNRSLFAFRPLLELSLDEQCKNLNLAWKRGAPFVGPLLVHVVPERASGDATANTGFLVGLSGGRLGRL
jgi:hypothetical protein